MRRRILENNGLGKETIQNLNDQHVYDFLIDIPENLKDEIMKYIPDDMNVIISHFYKTIK